MHWASSPYPPPLFQGKPTLRWVIQRFRKYALSDVTWVRLVDLEGRPLVLKLAPHHENVVRLLGVRRNYLLE